MEKEVSIYQLFYVEALTDTPKIKIFIPTYLHVP